ncbi:MAG: hypothetical protein Q4C00_07605 [Bacillota bacterium]|nr:hypothetical protein [Bacillota bacterium]
MPTLNAEKTEIIAKKLKGVLFIEGVINFFCSLILNALCAFGLNSAEDRVGVDPIGVMVDTMITGFCVTFLTICFSTAASKRYRKLGLFLRTPQGVLQRLPEEPLYLVVALMLPSCLCLTIIFNAVFIILGITSLPLTAYILFKGFWGGAFGVFVAITTIKRLLLRD